VTSSSRLTADVDRALEVLLNGGLVAIPTETVYGLAADASNERAVRRIFAVKGRPADHPLIVHLASGERVSDWCDDLPAAAAILADTCWPGPLTLLVPRGPLVPFAVTGGRDTVGLRVPAHLLTTELLDRFGGGLAAPSANRFGRVSPTTAAHVLADLGDDVDLVLDGGPCPIGVESTIVDCTVDPPQVLRPGAIDAEQVAALLRRPLAPTSGPSRAAGMLAAHYAPRCRVRLVETREEGDALAATLGDAVVIGGSVSLVQYANGLYGWLRDADREGLHTVVAVMPPAAGLGHAIRDRLLKASASRGDHADPTD
jgi:L-threonylcarbamoyladenylate synthase